MSLLPQDFPHGYCDPWDYLNSLENDHPLAVVRSGVELTIENFSCPVCHKSMLIGRKMKAGDIEEWNSDLCDGMFAQITQKEIDELPFGEWVIFCVGESHAVQFYGEELLALFNSLKGVGK